MVIGCKPEKYLTRMNSKDFCRKLNLELFAFVVFSFSSVPLKCSASKETEIAIYLYTVDNFIVKIVYRNYYEVDCQVEVTRYRLGFVQFDFVW